MRTVGITGAGGMLGFHLRALLKARGDFEVLPIPTPAFDDEAALRALVAKCDALVHLAYLIVGSPPDILRRNQEVAARLTSALTSAMEATSRPIPIVFASSTHVDRGTSYGESKRLCTDHFARFAQAAKTPFVTIVFPHIFGEGGKPFHNSVVSTFCYQLARGEEPTIHIDAPLSLLHAQDAAGEILAVLSALKGESERGARREVRPTGRPMSVSELLGALREIDRDYRALIVPDLRDPLREGLFNTYRSYLFPDFYRAPLPLREDARGALFEAVKTRHGGQAFVSTTRPGVTRGNHFHLRKLERFCVIQGEAVIRVRKLFSSEVTAFEVSGKRPSVIDIPTLHTHTITNTSSDDLITLFWAHEIFDPKNPDTFPEPVEESS